MRRNARGRVLAALSVGGACASLCVTSLAAEPLSEDRLRRLEQIILQQKKMLEEQQDKLQKQQQRIARQDERLKQIEGRRRTAGPKSANRDATKSDRVGILMSRDGFTAVDPLTLSLFRAGVQVPAVRVVMPDGSSFLAPADQFRYRLAQDVKPKEPDFITEPEKKEEEKKAAPPPRQPTTTQRRTRPPRRTVQQRRQPATPRRTPVPATQQRQTPAQPPTQEDESIRAEPERQVDQLLVERGAILLRPGTLQIEPGFEYATFSSSAVAISGVSLFNAIIIGTIRVDDVKRHVVTGSLKARYGIVSRLQVDLSVPFVRRSETEVLGVGTADVSERTITGTGLGDMEIGVTGQPIIGRGWIPNVLVRVGTRIPTGEDVFEIPTVSIGPGGQTRLTRAPTGNGFFGVFATTTAVWSIDPVAFFVGGGYTFNVPRTISGIGRLNPGDSFSYFTGMNIAVNDRVSLNLSFLGQNTFSTTLNGQKVPNTSFVDGRFTIGTSVGLTDRISLLANAAIGLTRQSPDFTFSVSVPITFNTN